MRKALLLLALLLLIGCDESSTENVAPERSLLEEIRRDGRLRVITRNAPTTYYQGRESAQGFEYELAAAFAEHLGVELELVVRDSVAEIQATLEQGEGHLAAAGLTPTDGRRESFRFGPPYHTVRQQVVCRRGGKIPKAVADLSGLDLAVITESSYVDRLQALKADYPQLQWRVEETLSTEQIMEQVWRRELDCTVADSTIVQINRRYYPELVVAFDLSPEQPLAWMLPKHSSELMQALEDWLAEAQTEQLLAALRYRYYAHVRLFDYVDVRTYYRRIEQRLPRYQALFRKAAAKHELPWTLLAAQAYQESHWNPRAKSPTGVRGLMMLTQVTARAVGVKNRLDPQQSIAGGARYLRRMIDRVPEAVQGEDRLWFALAAYNVGMGHMHDAQTLARQLGKDPSRWHELREVLPLLSQKKYYKNLRYGYARGTEPVRYVRRIRNFRDLLERHHAGQMVARRELSALPAQAQ